MAAGSARPGDADRHPAGALRRWAAAVLEACRVSPGDAELAARVLVRTSLRGIDTHGISRLAGYVERLRAGDVDPAAKPALRWMHGALRVDGAGGLGQVVASAAVDAAVARSDKQAAVACSISDCGHLAALGGFVLQAAEQGRVALLCQKTPPIMALAGAAAPAIGNNPIAFAAPLVGRPPLVFDMASSLVARGQVVEANRERRPIPEGWAVGPDGAPTTDPAAALKGAMLVECLAGALAEPAPAPPSAPGGSTVSAGGVSAFLLVVNPDRFVGRQAFDAAMNGWLEHYLRATGAGARYPGERQAACEAERQRNGIPIPPSLVAELAQTGERVGVPFLRASDGPRRGARR